MNDEYPQTLNIRNNAAHSGAVVAPPAGRRQWRLRRRVGGF